LVQTISFFQCKRKQEIDVAKSIADILRSHYPITRPGLEPWDKRVNAPGAHEHILQLVLQGLQQQNAIEAASEW
jgi:hypothetical protein